MKFHHFSISLIDFSFLFLKLFVPQAHVELFVLTAGIFILWNFDKKKNKARMATTMPIFLTPSITKNVFTTLYRSLTSKVFSTTTLHSTHNESEEAPLCVVQVFDANKSQRLLTLPGRVQKNSFFFLWTL
jgi:hypothetical protein